MDSLGNRALLNCSLVAFFASRVFSDDVVERVKHWAQNICRTENVVISGFHSPLEKEVLNIMLEHKHPVIMVLGRSIYERMPSEFSDALAADRMFITSIRNYARHSVSSAQIRNWYIAEIAGELVFAGLHAGSSLDVLYEIYKNKCCISPM